ncbi:MAG TPA: S8 family serine peptidase [Acidimicrobiales bacterium]|nr:S8 family serine peptidase [Acidimicrobiales bacterium]
MLGILAAPGASQEAPDFTSAGTLTPTDVVSADKAPTSQLAQSDEALVARTDAASARVMIKLDYDSVATYQGGVDDLAATSPSVTGQDLTGRSQAERAYQGYVDDRKAEIVADLEAAVPQVDVGSSLDVVYGGVSATVPANKVKDLLKVDGVVAVQANALNKVLTDNSPDFLGAPAVYDALGTTDNAGEGVIYGNLDTGVWPEHPSFADLGNLAAPPAPAGGGTRECNYGDNPLTPAADVFACQDKLIGGAHFTDDYDAFQGDDPLAGTARDSNGHGTHTASTSAGNAVDESPVQGVDRGAIHGLAPGAWVMEYKVCGPGGCFSSDTTRAVQQAILDGVDVINYSISGGTQPFSDSTELAFLDAYAAGVLVSASAGNEGPGAGTANHLSPWVTTIGASSQNRQWTTTLNLTAGNGDTFSVDGTSITGEGIDSPLPVVLAATAPGYNNALCTTPAPAGLFDGKIVACERGPNRVLKGFNVLQGGAEGMILYNPTLMEMMSDSHWIPTVALADGADFLAFLNGHTGVTGSFARGEAAESQGDVMTAFSSRGPGGLFIKPDVTAPGLQILAGASPFPGDPLASAPPPGDLFQSIAGTSMSSPHTAGAALLLADLHPDWTPGQIKSALMTTAVTDVVKHDEVTPADPFDMGAGRIDLSTAGTAPLSFDETADNFFALGNDPVNAVHLNLPSVNAPVMPGELSTTRVVENVSGRRQRFTVSTSAPSGAKITVSPKNFTLAPGRTATLSITIEAPVPGPQQFGQIDIDAQRGSDMHLPVAFVPQQAEVSLTQTCAPNPIQRGGTSACTVQAVNNSAEDTTADLFTEVTGGLRVAGTDGNADWVDNRNAQALDVPLAGRSPGVPAVDPGSLAGYLPLDTFGITPVAVGDEQIVNFNTAPFDFAGETWSRIGVDSNGYVVVGGGATEDNNCCNLPDGPDPARPNNVLAPFWTDLDGTGTAGIFVATLTDGVSDWIVVEHRVNVFGTTDLQVFQTWIGINGVEDITYAYDPANLPTNGGQDFLVGAENVLGEGDMVATLPTEDLRVTSTDAEPGDAFSYVVFVRGESQGTFPVTSSMAADTVPGITVVKSDITVDRRR